MFDIPLQTNFFSHVIHTGGKVKHLVIELPLHYFGDHHCQVIGVNVFWWSSLCNFTGN